MAQISLSVTTVGGGCHTDIHISLGATVAELHTEVKEALALDERFWLAAGDRRLSDNIPVAACRLVEGSIVTAIRVPLVKRLHASGNGFAALMSNQSVATWGDKKLFKNFERLESGVSQIHSNRCGFAALKVDGSAVSWALDDEDGESWHAVAHQLQSNVQHICSSDNAFAALKDDGSVVKWCGDPEPAATTEQLQNRVVQLTSVGRGFVASVLDGTPVFWYDSLRGSDALAEEAAKHGAPRNVVCVAVGSEEILGTARYIGMQMADGSLVMVREVCPNDVPEAPVVEKLCGVKQLCGTHCAVIALSEEGSIISWLLSGPEVWHATPAEADDLRKDCTRIFSTGDAFAVLKSNGSVFTFSEDTFKNPVCVITSGSYVINIHTNDGAFAALKSDGSVVCWGDSKSGGRIEGETADELSNGVSLIVSADRAFAALKADGSVVAWGQKMQSCRAFLRESLQEGVVEVVASKTAFAARKRDGQVWTWGPSNRGGNSEVIASILRPFDVSGV